ncbi:uncharacterized protein J8A68_004964 [[Candida] subhashii]|uniref:Inositol polyphosphate-related phosphatase domain-containing protein n=1 Tax=[Candida] subhashii TaxID=561895 RepID=A0A8J5UU95_9ASCO|nr:uncharacterized protein J8A68_004964 [[Candida] subhashii]KAG7661505.1 hypothetical protein J8A68_004964 [[Candida] subhashii]
MANQHLIEYDCYFLQALNEKYGSSTARFRTIAMHHIGAIGIVVISPYASKFYHIRLAQAGCGYAKSSLKGGVGVRMAYHSEGGNGSYENESEISVAVVHLSAYEGEAYYRTRNDDILTIMRAMDFGDGYGLIKPRGHVFVLGDLNYRTRVDEEGMKKLLAMSDESSSNGGESAYELNLKFDELTNGMRKGDIFLGFQEAKIEFQPTYKFVHNTAIYNWKRSPSWCDRILYQATYEGADRNTLRELNKGEGEAKDPSLPHVSKYHYIDSLMGSDHRPVYLWITVPISPPEPIISSAGYLQIIGTESIELIRAEEEVELENMDVRNTLLSGPTSIYLKPTKYDFLIQNIVRPSSDSIIGYGLWFSTTRKGRLTLLAILLVLWFLRLWY